MYVLTTNGSESLFRSLKFRLCSHASLAFKSKDTQGITKTNKQTNKHKSNQAGLTTVLGKSQFTSHFQ